MSEWKKICCAVDFSDASRFAMEQAAELARRSGGELTLVHVTAERVRHGAELPYRSELRGVHAGEVGRDLEEWRSAAARTAGRPVFAAVLTGVPVDEILRFAREGRHDVIVIGTPGTQGCERIVLASVADGVVRRAPCSVVVARRHATA